MKTRLAALAVLLATQAAYAVNVDREDFPSASSTVVGSVGFIDATQVGYFWSKARGDSVTQTFVTTETNVTRAVFDFTTPFNDLIGFNVDWNVLGDDPLAPLRRWRDDLYRHHRGRRVTPA
jgi:hypothetical protein